MNSFKLVSKYQPTGDQPEAIRQLTEGIQARKEYQTLLGVTGSGKTFSMANVIEQVNRPVLIISHNKTLAAQLYGEFKQFFPHNAVEYFISYFDYFVGLCIHFQPNRPLDIFTLSTESSFFSFLVSVSR